VQASHVEPSPAAVASTADQEDQEPIMVDVEDTNDQVRARAAVCQDARQMGLLIIPIIFHFDN
jgi:hypothetical protein